MNSRRKIQPKWRERRKMTICIGMLAEDGIVIATDAEESDTYFTRSQQKILTWHTMSSGGAHTPAACAIAGAGDAGFIDAFSHELLKRIRGEMTMPEFETYAEETVKNFYGNHVRPLLKVDPNVDFRVLIGAYFRFSTCLLMSYKSTIRRVFPTAAIGIGGSFAMRVMDEHMFRDIRHTEITAASVIAVTKDCIEGCGKYTDIVSIHNPVLVEGIDGAGSQLHHPNPPLSRVRREKIDRWEKSFGSTWSSRQKNLTSELIEKELKKDEELEKRKAKQSASRKSANRR
jgi:hypothetical protein